MPLLGVTVAACSSSGSSNAPSSAGTGTTSAATSATSPSSSGSSAAGATSSAGPVDLASVCPNPVKIVTDWTPESEQGGYYELAASGGQIDKNGKTYTAPLLDPSTGQPTNVNVQIITGGPAVGYIQTPQLLTTKPDILMGADDADAAILDSQTAPVIGIVAPLDNSLHIILWNPAKYDFKSVQDVGKSNASVLYFKGTAFIEYLAGAGILKESQLDGSYQGNPSRFVATDGGVTEQGFATAEPFIYTHELPAWNKPVAYALTSNTGFNPYSEMGEATPANVKKYAACFKKLVPMIQRAEIKFVQDPTRVNDLIVQLNTAFGNLAGPYDADVAAYAVKTLLADKIVEQPASGAFGSFDTSRINQLIDQIRPIMSTTGSKPLPSSFNVDSVVTNEFIDPSVTFSGYSGPYNDTTGVITVAGTK